MLQTISTLNSTFHKQTFVTHSIMFTDGAVDTHNIVHGGNVTDRDWIAFASSI